MPEKNLTHQDAELTLRLYELRREEKMRQARDIVNGQFWPDNLEEVLQVYSWKHPFNAAIRQAGSYWEMVYGMARNRIIDADYLMENNGEGLILYAKIEPYLSEIRRRLGDNAFRNAEWITTNSAVGKAALERIRGRLKLFREMVEDEG